LIGTTLIGLLDSVFHHIFESQDKQDIGGKKIMSHCGLKSPRLGLLPDEENRKCGIVKYCAEFLSIGNHNPKHNQTRGGLSMKRDILKNT
jgi:hypothetical protein